MTYELGGRYFPFQLTSVASTETGGNLMTYNCRNQRSVGHIRQYIQNK